MARHRIEKRLRETSEQLKKLRDELAIAEEQLEHFAAIAEDTRLRALVSETPVSDRENRDAQRHADRLEQQRDGLREQIDDLERSQDALLDRLAAERA